MSFIVCEKLKSFHSHAARYLSLLTSIYSTIPYTHSDFRIVDIEGYDAGTSGLLLYKGGTVCDDNFNQNAANAICSFLGYDTGGSEWNSGNRWSTQSEYSISLDDVTCRSNDWSACTYRKDSNCVHDEDVFLICKDQQTATA